VAFFAAFFTATFFAAAFVDAFLSGADCAFSAALCRFQRFFVAAIIFFIPSALIFRFGFGASGVAGSGVAGAVASDVPLAAAQRLCCASFIRRRAAALNFLRLPGTDCGVAAVSAGTPDNMDLSSTICWSSFVFCDSKPSIAASIMLSVSFGAGMRLLSRFFHR
jgi:hypothetical protein